MMRVLKIGVGSQIGAGLSGYCAEINAAFCCASLGIVPTVRHADYIGAWLRLCSPCHKLNNREVLIM